MPVRFALVFALLLAGCQPGGEAPAEPPLETDDHKAFYALGLALAENLQGFSLAPDELERVVLGLRDGISGKPERVEDRARYAMRVRQIQGQRTRAVAERERVAGAEYLAAMAAEAGAETRESGVIVRILEEGSGASPTGTSKILVRYHGTLRDGTVFDSTRKRGGQPVPLTLNAVIPCWQEAIPLLKVGGKAKISCPPERAYGSRGAGSIPAGAALTFEVELVEIQEG